MSFDTRISGYNPAAIGSEFAADSLSSARTVKNSSGEVPPVGESLNASTKITLPSPQQPVKAQALQDFMDGAVSLGAAVLVMVQRSAAEMVRDNRETSYQAGMASADLKDQMAEERKKIATIQLACGITQGIVQIASGGLQTIGGIKTLGQTGMGESDKSAYLQGWTGGGQMLGGLGQMVGSIGQALSTAQEAAITKLEGDQKRIDTTAEQVKAITDSMQQAVSQAISSAQTIGQSETDALKRILA